MFLHRVFDLPKGIPHKCIFVHSAHVSLRHESIQYEITSPCRTLILLSLPLVWNYSRDAYLWYHQHLSRFCFSLILFELHRCIQSSLLLCISVLQTPSLNTVAHTKWSRYDIRLFCSPLWYIPLFHADVFQQWVIG